MKAALLIVPLCAVALAAQAQGTGEVYAAPGMAVRVPRRLSPAPTQHRPAGVLKHLVPVASPVLPRFWQKTDTAKSRAAYQLYQVTGSQLKYPANTLRAGIDGVLYVRLTIAADGTVSQADITRRELKAEGGDASYFEKGKTDIDAEVLRVAKTLRFKPSSLAIDTVTITQRFVIQ